MTRDLFEETLQAHGTEEQREAYAALVERHSASIHRQFRAGSGKWVRVGQ